MMVVVGLLCLLNHSQFLNPRHRKILSPVDSLLWFFGFCPQVKFRWGSFFMARAQAPEFGNWDGEEILYTMYFDNARKVRKSNQIHQTDRQDNIDVELEGQKASELKMPRQEQPSGREEFELTRSIGSPNVRAHHAMDSPHKLHSYPQPRSDKLESEALKALEMLRPSHNLRTSHEERDKRKLTDLPWRHETGVRRNSSNSPHHHYGGSSAGNTPRNVTHRSVGSDRGGDHSPLHPYSPARVGVKGVGVSSPSWDRKSTSEGGHNLAPSTPGRSRLRSPDRSSTVPKFGEWDETDPATADEYSQIFNRVRNEKQSETEKVPSMPTEASFYNNQKQYGNNKPKGCSCFPWGKR